jgi:hypothetical protein
MNKAVKFLHPGHETPDIYFNNDNCLWKFKPTTSEDQVHSRKFLLSEGRYIKNPKGRLLNGEIGFWGEYEASSKVETNPFYNNFSNSRENNFPRYFHRPIKPSSTPKSPGIHYENTDPCVFGENFFYAVCQQHNPKAKFLRNLNKGDVIVFGSCFSPKKDKEFVIDTVFVVDEKEKYSPKDASKLGNKVPDWYYHLTLNLITDTKEYILFKGATYQKPVDGMFSFFPCILKEEYPQGFVRPSINGSKISQFQNNGHNRGAGVIKDADAKTVWNEIVKSLQRQNLYLGTSATLENLFR